MSDHREQTADFLGRLVDRTRDRLPLLRPRLPSLFEPMKPFYPDPAWAPIDAAAEAADTQVPAAHHIRVPVRRQDVLRASATDDEEAMAAADDPSRVVPSPAPDDRGPQSVGAQLDEHPGAAVSITTEPGRHTRLLPVAKLPASPITTPASAQSAIPAVALPRAAYPGAVLRPRGEPLESPGEIRRAEARGSTAPAAERREGPPRQAGNATSVPPVASVCAGRDPAVDGADGERAPAPDLPPRIGALVPAPGLAVPRILVPTETRPRRAVPDRADSRAPTASEPVINVTIGRVEVRAVPAAPAPRPDEPKGRRPMGLEEYLKQRGGGR